jgi:aryl-alcohol dehydrogenase-like predicted oxidoreductase
MLVHKPLGSTGILISPLGLGTVKFGRNQQVKYPQPFDLPDDQALVRLLNCARDLNINLIDTAPAYGESESRLGRLLKQDRQNWVIVTKTGEEFIDGQSQFDFSADHTRLSIERSLKRLGTDYLDIVLVHSNGEDINIIQQENIFSALSAIKKAGLIRAFGMSTKTVEGGKLAAELSDVVMVTYNPEYTSELEVITHAHQLNKGVLIKKALASGHTTDSLHDRMQFIFEQPGVSGVIVGTLNPAHLIQNAEAVG